MSDLAQRLNDLALANEQRLLDDHEYRILRQSAFELYANDPPPERPVIAISSRPAHKPKPDPADHPSPSTSPTSPTRIKPSLVTNLFRRATGRRKPAPLSLEQPATPTESTKRSVIPRILHRKPTDPPPPKLRSPKLSQTPSQASLSLTLASPSSPRALNFDHAHDTDDQPLTAAQIRATMDETRKELHKLMDAFDVLEMTTRRRDTRHPSLPPTPTSYVFPDPQRRRPARPDSGTSDGISIRSGSSAFTSRSQAASALSPDKYPLKHKHSISSISSHATSRRGPSSSFSLSKSTGHLPLTMLPESESLDSVPDPKIADVRIKRQKVIDRYEARLEYLNAKLRSAELHEKLLRK